MGFGADVFWPAFRSAGMLDVAIHQPPHGVAVSFDVGFNRPDKVVLDGMVHTTDYSIEYQVADVELKRGDVVRILGVDYKVQQTPTAKADGSFYVAILERLA
ncbi:head-tail joining protein [Telluria sp. B2]